MEFVGALPAWVGDDGYPLSWRHFIHGMSYIRRANARRQIENAATTRVAGFKDESYGAWRNEMSGYAGL